MIQTHPKVSIGLPVYNGERYLAETIQSLRDQVFSDFEIIICDNASTDGTAEICRRYLTLDKRIRYYRHSKNLGAAFNFNRTFKLASGKYFKWAAHDDLVEKDRYRHQVDAKPSRLAGLDHHAFDGPWCVLRRLRSDRVTARRNIIDRESPGDDILRLEVGSLDGDDEIGARGQRKR